MKKKLITLGAVILALLSMFFLYLLTTRKPNTLPSQAIPNVSFKSLVPGESTEEDVIDLLGNPKIEGVDRDNGHLLEFDSDSSVYNNQITLDNGVVDIIKEIVTLKNPKYADGIKRFYGEPKYVLYGSDSYAGFNLYVYAESGVAYLGNPDSGLLLQIWYFPSTTYEMFKEKYASEYSETLEIRQ